MSIYQEQWNNHVARWKEAGKDKWPDDQWGNPHHWQLVFDLLFASHGVENWEHAVELGGGSGKYTKKSLEVAPKLKILGYDVSEAFLEVCAKRLEEYVKADRLELNHIPGKDSDELFLSIEERGLVRKLDAFFSIDAMVHVDLQYLTAYLITAALTLRENGLLILTLADATTDLGFDHLIQTLPYLYQFQGRPTAKFEFVSKEIVSSIMKRLGFEIVFMENWRPGRDIFLVAKLVDLELANSFRSALSRAPEVNAHDKHQ